MSGPGRGGNLTQPLKKVLINVPSADNLGAYVDNQIGDRILQFKRHGYSLPATGNVTVSVQRPQPAVRKIATVQLSNVAPANTQNYEYGVNLLKHVRKPGIDNNNFFPHQKYYGGIMPNVTANTIAAGELNTMRDNIIARINADRGYANRPEYEMNGAPVIASRPLYLENWNKYAAITLDTDTEIGFIDSHDATIEDFVASINATELFAASVISDTELVIVRKTELNADDAIVFARAAAPTATPSQTPTPTSTYPWNEISSVAAVDGEFALYQRWDDATFEVKIKPTVGTSTTLTEGSFAFLTQDEVFQTFSHLPNMGFLAQEVRPVNMPLPNTDYVKVNIDVGQTHYALDGASHAVMFITAIELYVPEAEWDSTVDKWATAAGNPLRMMDAGTDDTLAELIAWWQA